MVLKRYHSNIYRCPNCTRRKFWKLADGRRKCVRCGFRFSSYYGLRKSRRYLRKLAEYFCLGVPAYRLRFSLPISLATIEKVFLWFRQLIYSCALVDLKKLSGRLELDETMFGGRKSGKRGWGAEGKVIVFGVYKRNGQVVTFPVPDRRKRTLLPLIDQHTRTGSIYYTDDYEGYASLVAKGQHLVIQKQRGVPQTTGCTINGIEGFWSYAKTWLYHYRGVPKKYFALYLKEIEWRFNYRNNYLLPILAKLIRSYR